MKKFQKLWEDIKASIKSNIGYETYEDTFEPIKNVHSFENDYLYIIVPNVWIQQKINNLYIKQITNIGCRIYDDKIGFKFVTIEEAEEIFNPKKLDLNESVPNYIHTNLNANNTFSNFVVGKSNNYAFKVSMKVASQPGVVNNPLYIFGGVGLGKTHLMQAIANYVLEEDINKKILYIKAVEFIEEYVFYLNNNNMVAFNAKYRDIDMLLIDDIQSLRTAPETQSQFFKIFDRLKNNNKQIIITSDRPPRELHKIMDRLTSRFAEGLIIDIDIPELSHRIDILKYELEHQFDPNSYAGIPDKCFEYIAEHFVTNIRELKGALKRAMTYCEAFELEHNLKNFKVALAPLIDTKKKTGALSENNYDKIISVVAAYYSISVDGLIGKSKSSKFTNPRHISMYLIKTLYDVPYKKIGSIFSNRDHSTVISACSKIERGLKRDFALQKAIDTIVKKIKQ